VKDAHQLIFICSIFQGIELEAEVRSEERKLSAVLRLEQVHSVATVAFSSEER